MPYSEKQVADKITRTTEAWEEHALDAKFAEMTLDQLKAKVPSLDCGEKMASAAPARSGHQKAPGV